MYLPRQQAAIDLASNPSAAFHPAWVRTDIGRIAADLDVDESAQGTLAQIDALSLINTGSFLAYERQPLDF